MKTPKFIRQIALSFLCAVFLITGCSQPQNQISEEKPPMTNIEKMERALDELRQRKNEDAFVIFENSETKKFVQFAGKYGDPFYLDLPQQTLNEQEFKRAQIFFDNLGTKVETYETLDALSGQPAGTQTSFNLEIENSDYKKAAKIALEIFVEVYGYNDNFPLGVDEN